ncbi:MAG: NAD-dependent epimerase/dehydratase family protein [Candidatus Hermodarchaeota archaeon]
MFVLLTGAFGNIGESALIALLERNHHVRCFDLQTRNTEKKQKQLQYIGEFDTVWGDILDSEIMSDAIKDIECIIHLAAIIPPMSDHNPDLAFRVNVDGTRNIINASEASPKKPKLIIASSVSIFGPTMHLQPPRRASDPINPTDTYTQTKMKCETMIRESTIPWTILRLAAVPPLEVNSDISVMFEIPLDQRIEFVHTRDVGVAFANSVSAETQGKTLLIGGGKDSQMLQIDFIRKILSASGLNLPPEEAFRTPSKPEEYFYTDWLDTEESQKLLQYQSRTFDEYLEEIKRSLGYKRYLAKLFKGLAMRKIVASSPYIRKKEN